MSRVDAVKAAVMKGGDRLRGSVVASDAFFPFRDGLDAVAAAGATAVVQPGGSVRDAEVSLRPPTSTASPWSSPAAATFRH